MKIRRTEYRNLGLVIACISFFSVLLIHGVREEQAVAGIVVIATCFVLRRPIHLTGITLGLIEGSV